MARKNWTREELIVAFNLYCKTSFGQIHNRNPEIIDLANLIGRTPSAVSWKLANFSRLDPSLQKRGIVGATHGSKSEEAIWDEFNEDWEQLSFTSEKLLAQFKGRPIEEIANVNILDGVVTPASLVGETATLWTNSTAAEDILEAYVTSSDESRYLNHHQH